MLGRRLGNVVSVAAHAVTHQLGEDGSAAPLGKLQIFKDQNAGAFANDETIAG